MLLRRRFSLLVATFVIVSAALRPMDVLATISTPQPGEPASIAVGDRPFPAVPEADGETPADLVWTSHQSEQDSGFTEAAIAYDPNLDQNAKAYQQLGSSVAPKMAPPASTKVPEPAALILFGTVLIGIAHASRRKAKP